MDGWIGLSGCGKWKVEGGAVPDLTNAYVTARYVTLRYVRVENRHCAGVWIPCETINASSYLAPTAFGAEYPLRLSLYVSASDHHDTTAELFVLKDRSLLSGHKQIRLFKDSYITSWLLSMYIHCVSKKTSRTC